METHGISENLPTYTDSNTSQNCDEYKTYLYSDNSNTKEDIVLATNSALKNIVNGNQEHAEITCMAMQHNLF